MVVLAAALAGMARFSCCSVLAAVEAASLLGCSLYVALLAAVAVVVLAAATAGAAAAAAAVSAASTVSSWHFLLEVRLLLAC